MKEAEIQIGCTYRVSETQGGGTITIKNRTDLSAAFDLYMSGDLEAIVLDPLELKKLGFNDAEYKNGYIGTDIKRPNSMITDFVLTKPEKLAEWQNFYAFEFGNHRFVQLDHVHHLQRLFYSHTGLNLPYNEK